MESKLEKSGDLKNIEGDKNKDITNGKGCQIVKISLINQNHENLINHRHFFIKFLFLFFEKKR